MTFANKFDKTDAMKKYEKRIADGLLARKLEGMGAVLVQGAKWCGKTTTCEQIARSALYMGDPVRRKERLEMASIDISALLDGARPRLIDEWQVAPAFWDAVRHAVDHADHPGQFILTGSVVPPRSDEISHSGTGRIARLTMRPMTLWESGESSGAVSLGGLFSGRAPETGRAREWSLGDIAWRVCRGGWPQAVLWKGDVALDLALEYVGAVADEDISRVDGVKRDPARARRLLRSYARLQGTQANLRVLKCDMAGGGIDAPDEDTVASYRKALEKLFVVEDMPAWCPNLRCKTPVRTSDTRYFADPSIATAALGLGPGDLMNDLTSFGFFFETMAVRDLRVYAEALGGSVAHYRDAGGLECDAVIHLRNGAYGLAEIKLGGDVLVEEGAKTLAAFAAKIDTGAMKEPAFRMVVTAVGDFAYHRRDGVFVCPLAALGP